LVYLDNQKENENDPDQRCGWENIDRNCQITVITVKFFCTNDASVTASWVQLCTSSKYQLSDEEIREEDEKR
jgi:hypothetical protein